MRRISIFPILCKCDGVPSQTATIPVSLAELNIIILILHIGLTRKQLFYYILPLHTSKSSTPSLAGKYYWLTIRYRAASHWRDRGCVDIRDRAQVAGTYSSSLAVVLVLVLVLVLGCIHVGCQC